MRFTFNLLLALPAVFAAPAPESKAVGGSWIVKLKAESDFPEVLARVKRRTNIEPTYEYSIGDFVGFSVENVASLTTLLSIIPEVESIEQNTIVSTNALTTQENATWGLARISHREPGSTTYVYDDTAGNGTYAYVIDTGIFTDHNEFGGRATFGANFAGDSIDTDGNGHGTHVAGTIGSGTYGVAKLTQLIAVKVLGADGSGTNADVLAGIDWAFKHANSNNYTGKAVANLSLGGARSSMTNAAVAEAVKAGLFMAVAAGNDGFFAYFSSPASEPSVCTVGATDKDDKLAEFSNIGTLVDILAPGVDIMSTWIGNKDATNVISGTSMATPHVAGLAAYLLGLGTVPTEPVALCKHIQGLSTKDKVVLSALASFWDNTKNYLAYNGNDGGNGTH